ncbi:hypothetical protein [Pseudomonas vranovensis]|uniref:hypothetical protein n=1 Tax=Pseudomonas vranovensis TaxID=321661 RepID=UPI003D975F2D
MLDAPFFDPRMPWWFDQVAKDYSQKLATLGKCLFVGSGALFFVPLTQWLALGLAGALLVTAVILGRAYNKHVDEFIEHTSLANLIKIFAPTWRFVLMTSILLGVGCGLTEWSFFAEYKQIIIGLFVSGGILDLAKGLFSN